MERRKTKTSAPRPDNGPIVPAAIFGEASLNAGGCAQEGQVRRGLCGSPPASSRAGKGGHEFNEWVL